MHSVAFESFGARFGVRFHNTRLVDEIHACLPRQSRAIDLSSAEYWFTLSPIRRRYAGKRAWGYHILGNGAFMRWAPSNASLREALEPVLHLHVAEWATPWVFLHAGVVTIDGLAVVLPGSSMAGKSTLVHALVEDGATYYSDEFAVLDHQGNVFPFRRALSLRTGPFGMERRVPDLADADPPPAAAGLVAFLRREAGTTLAVNPISDVRAGMLATQHSVGIRRYPEQTFAAISALMRHAQRFEGTRGEFDEAVNWARDTLKGPMASASAPPADRPN
jgi:hypothetical protein